MVAEAFMSIDDPLLIVSSSRDSGPRILSFSNKNSSNSGHTCSNNVDVCDLPSSSNTLPGDANLNVNLVDGCNLNWKIIKKVSDIINGLKEESLNLSLLSDPDANTIKKELDRNRHILSTTHNHEKSRARKFTIIVRAAFNDMSMLSNAFDESPQNLEHIHFHMIRKGIGSLLSVKPKIDKFLKNSVMSRELKAGKVVVVSQCISSTNTSTTKIEDTTGDGSKGKKNRKSKGKKK